MQGKKNMQATQSLLITVTTLVILCFCLPFTGLAAAGDGGGAPDDHGRQKDSDDAGAPRGDLFGDQWMVIRDVLTGGDGAPVMFQWIWPEDLVIEGDLVIGLGDLPESYTQNSGECVQPFSLEPVSGILPEEQFTYSPYIDSYGGEQEAYLIPLDDECKIPEAYAETWGTEVLEVESGRLNIARSEQAVLDSSYEEALSTINMATSMKLDPAGRLMLIGLPERDTPKTIDSPLENLALYQRLMLDGCLTATQNVDLTDEVKQALDDAGLGSLVCQNDNESISSEDLLRAASFLAGGGDKTGDFSVDLIIYLNNSLNINDVVIEQKKDGSAQVVGYFSFDTFIYSRNAEDQTIKADLLQPPEPTDEETYPSYFDVANNVAVFPIVFESSWDGYTEAASYPIINFTRAADDALAIINYIHNFALPEYPMPALP